MLSSKFNNISSHDTLVYRSIGWSQVSLLPFVKENFKNVNAKFRFLCNLFPAGYIETMSFREFFHRALGGSAPELVGGDLWLNSEPITILNKPDHVFMVDFWTYS